MIIGSCPRAFAPFDGRLYRTLDAIGFVLFRRRWISIKQVSVLSSSPTQSSLILACYCCMGYYLLLLFFFLALSLFPVFVFGARGPIAPTMAYGFVVYSASQSSFQFISYWNTHRHTHTQKTPSSSKARVRLRAGHACVFISCNFSLLRFCRIFLFCVFSSLFRSFLMNVCSNKIEQILYRENKPMSIFIIQPKIANLPTILSCRFSLTHTAMHSFQQTHRTVGGTQNSLKSDLQCVRACVCGGDFWFELAKVITDFFVCVFSHSVRSLLLRRWRCWYCCAVSLAPKNRE